MICFVLAKVFMSSERKNQSRLSVTLEIRHLCRCMLYNFIVYHSISHADTSVLLQHPAGHWRSYKTHRLRPQQRVDIRREEDVFILRHGRVHGSRGREPQGTWHSGWLVVVWCSYGGQALWITILYRILEFVRKSLCTELIVVLTCAQWWGGFEIRDWLYVCHLIHLNRNLMPHPWRALACRFNLMCL